MTGMTDATRAAFTCPCCGATSSHPEDIAHRYCSRCHAFTGDPELGPAHLAEPCAERKVTEMTGTAPAPPHAYVSTACFHEEHGACRKTCKYCNAPCSCTGCDHAGTPGLPEPWVDQARAVAAELLDAIYPADVPDGLERRIATDPALFWLRGETRPPGEWHD
jgi:hypothetical protein